MLSRVALTLNPVWPEQVTYSSDYFQRLYEFAIQLIQSGNAYVDHQTQDEIKAYRRGHDPTCSHTRETLALYLRSRKQPAEGAAGNSVLSSRPAAWLGALLQLFFPVMRCGMSAHDAAIIT